jgi:hypothetical protein
MATISNLNVAIVRNVANADVTVTYDLFWSDFDQLTNLEYIEKLDLIGDDTDQDGDNPPAGDDPIADGPRKPVVIVLRSNGAASTSRTLNKTIPFRLLDEDHSGGNDSDEIRALITLTPQLPVTVTNESANFVVVTA